MMDITTNLLGRKGTTVEARLFRPSDPVLRPDPFDDGRFIFELKHDGFRALAHVSPDGCQLVSRQRNAYKSFKALCESLATLVRSAVLDGEIVVLDGTFATRLRPAPG
ncbi:MAG: hypothetical protein ABSB35_25580 [Bryobacteraceae bacterium]|jgi:bifunctional non-homologous end joining protein LigD